MPSPVLDDLPAALSEHVGYLLVRLGKHSQRLFSLAVEPMGLRPPHCDILLTLAERGSLSQVEIAATLAIERAHLVALIDQLEHLGFVERRADAHDRRRHAVALTATGTQSTQKLATIATQVEQEIIAGLSQPEQTALRATLRVLARGAEEGTL